MKDAKSLPRAALLFVALFSLWIASLLGLVALNGLARWSVGLLYVFYDTWLIVFVARELAAPSQAATPTPNAQVGSRPQSVAVLISARNEVRALPATLDALLAQDHPAEEIWLIDDGSTDDTRQMLAQRYGVDSELDVPTGSLQHPSLHVLLKPNSGKADSLNRGIGLAASDLIVTLDADTILREDAIGAMRSAFMGDPKLVAAGGVLTPTCGPGMSGRIFEWFQTFEYLRAFIARVAWMRSNALLLVSGAFACFRREAVNGVGRFDTRSWVEDYELIHRLHRFGHQHRLEWRVGVVAEAVASTDAPGNLPTFLRQRRRWFAGFLQTQYRYRDMVANRAYGAVGIVMLPLKMIDTLQPLFGITAFLLLLYFLILRQPVLWPVMIVIGVKLIIDFGFLLWGVSFYNRWKRQHATPRQWVMAGLAALTEPFCFQLLRHVGAMLGWLAILTQKVDWVPQRNDHFANPPQVSRYSAIAIALHWLMAAGLIINVCLALSVDYLSDNAIRPIIDLHKSMGITLLGLVLLRVLWRSSHTPPALNPEYAVWERRMAHVVHYGLYIVMVLLPLSGWMHDSAWKDAAAHPMRLFGLFEWPRIGLINSLDPVRKETLHSRLGNIHTVLGYCLYALFALHVTGAVKHQLFDRKAEIQRILPGTRGDPRPRTGSKQI